MPNIKQALAEKAFVFPYKKIYKLISNEVGKYTIHTKKEGEQELNEKNVIPIYEEGNYVIHKDYGIGRVVCSVEDFLDEIINAYDLLESKNKKQQTEYDKRTSILLIAAKTGVEFIKKTINGHSCNNKGITGYCLWVDGRDLNYLTFSELKNKKVIGKFGCVEGAKVIIEKVQIGTHTLNSCSGKFITYVKGTQEAIIELSKQVSFGHSLDGKGKSKCCINVPIDTIFPLERIRAVVPAIDDGNLTNAELCILYKSGIDVNAYIEHPAFMASCSETNFEED